MKSYNKDWQYIPFQDRADVYSKSIKMVQHLWVKPSIEVKETLEPIRILVVDKHEHSINTYQVDGQNKALMLELLSEFCQVVK